ncbi:hypothetical protein [Thermoactinomyces daqus]|uniref:hypothetical protein n=1 Tax=Thermoactinomyces daqus TaxID=1329516 RepID=UPI000AF4D7D9|nr:hypothetical protein [Thermoactinomyces daqus]
MDEFVPRSEQSLQPDQKNGKKKILDWAKAILLALILAVLIRMFVFEPFPALPCRIPCLRAIW